MEPKIDYNGKTYAIMVVVIDDAERDYDGVVVRMLKARNVSHMELLSPLLHHDAYGEAYHFLTQFALDNKFVYIISDVANGVIRTMRENGTDPVTRVVRLVELDQREIHAKSESKKRAFEAQKEAGRVEEEDSAN